MELLNHLKPFRCKSLWICCGSTIVSEPTSLSQYEMKTSASKEYMYVTRINRPYVNVKQRRETWSQILFE